MLDYQKASADDKWSGAALEKPASIDADSEQARFFREINPIGKIPAIERGGHVISESGATIAYFADVFPLSGLAATDKERADYYRWMFFAAGPVEQAVTNRRGDFVPLPQQEFFFGHGSYERTLDQLEYAVTRHPYIAGDRFTAAACRIRWDGASIPNRPQSALTSHRSSGLNVLIPAAIVSVFAPRSAWYTVPLAFTVNVCTPVSP